MIESMIAKAKTIKGRMHHLAYKWKMRVNWFDISRWLDTSDCVDKEFLYDSISSPNKQYMVRYVPTNLKQLKPLLERLIAVDRSMLEGTLVDFGCGKGRVLIMAERMGFRQVIGVEFSKKLYDICRKNIQKMKSSAQVVLGDAVDLTLNSRMRVFYFCNPFEYCVLEKVLNNIKCCPKEKGVSRYIVYIDPRKFGRLESSQYELLYNHQGEGSPYHLYRIIE